MEHETGIEIILLGAAAGVLATATTTFIKGAWGKWKELRKQRSVFPATPVIEIPRTDPDAPLRLVHPPPVSDDELARYLKIADELRPAA